MENLIERVRWGCALAPGVLSLLVGCGGEAESGTDTTFSQKLGPTFIDVEGRRWIEIGPAKFSTEEEDQAYQLRRGHSYDSGPDFANMPIDDIVAKVRPKSLAPNGKEYTMDLDSAREFAAVIQSDARKYKGREAELITEGGPPAEGTFGEDPFAPDGDRAGKIVYGTDQRQRINSPGLSSPWMRIGRHGGDTFSAGTVFKIFNQHTATSAAHVFNNGGTSWRPLRAIRFGDSLSQPSPWQNFGPPTESFCYLVTVPSAWDGSDRAYDVAVLAFRGRGGAWCPTAQYQSGWFGSQGVGACTTGINGSVSGYPVSPPFGVAPSEQFWHQNATGFTSCPTFPTQLWHENDTTNGQSGSPYWTLDNNGVRSVRGIHWGNDPGFWDDTNGARRIDSTVVNWWSSWGGF
jgi:hypothetical protein